MEIGTRLQQERLSKVPSCLDQFETKQMTHVDDWIDRFIARLSAFIKSLR
jgi:hypothetical protein